MDMRESKLTLRVGENYVTFGVHRVMKHSRFGNVMVFSVDTFEELLEKELTSWQEDNTGGVTFFLEGDFILKMI